ncbi:unnamed protein product [Mycena citricolor]|uniref:NmrA-like domain-containing protein n=1 Tax=Mycena citricolor TaxID=2018698 RepID=A0AAD2K1E8_9AGAR|nr:unnamed protein product [Mycena citricolor]
MKVALAGAGAGVGRCIAEAILANGNHTLVVLSRSADIPFLSSRGALITTVDYSDPASIARGLDGVHTVISTIGDHSKSASAQLALVHAACAAGVARFVPSGWSAANVAAGSIEEVELYRYKQPVLDALRAQTLMKWSHPENGIFLNYFATPSKGIAYLKPLKFWIDVEQCKAVIPGDGNIPLAYTAVEDVGAFIAKALDSNKEWPRSFHIVGAKVTHNELVRMAERVRGCSFEVEYCSAEQYTASLVPNPPSLYVNLATQLSLILISGRFTFDSTFDHAVVHKFMQPQEFIEKWWGHVHQ